MKFKIMLSLVCLMVAATSGFACNICGGNCDLGTSTTTVFTADMDYDELTDQIEAEYTDVLSEV